MSTTATTIDPERQTLGEVEMVGRDRWEEIHRRAGQGASIRAIARELDLDRKTVRRCLRQTEWKPYQIGDRGTLHDEVSGWSTDVNGTQRGVDWQMKIDDARCKLKSVYRNIIK